MKWNKFSEKMPDPDSVVLVFHYYFCWRRSDSRGWMVLTTGERYDLEDDSDLPPYWPTDGVWVDRSDVISFITNSIDRKDLPDKFMNYNPGDRDFIINADYM